MCSTIEVQTRIEASILKTSVAVGANFVFCWSWASFYYLLVNLNAGNQSNYFYNQFSTTMLMISCDVNPVLYAVNLHHFKAGLNKMLNRWRASFVTLFTTLNLVLSPSS